jgi:hypothetical protein
MAFKAAQEQNDPQVTSLPLFTNFLKSRKSQLDKIWFVNDFTYSKSEEWFLAKSNLFVVLVKADSKQCLALLKLIYHCTAKGTAVGVVYDKTNKSSACFGEMDDLQVAWEEDIPEEVFARYHFHKATDNTNNESPPTQSPVKQQRRRRVAPEAIAESES